MLKRSEIAIHTPLHNRDSLILISCGLRFITFKSMARRKKIKRLNPIQRRIGCITAAFKKGF
jgi:hypothetical protein